MSAEETFLRLAILKERADYRKFFTAELRAAVETAYENPEDEANFTEIVRFQAELIRFGVHNLLLPPGLTRSEWLDIWDPRVDTAGLKGPLPPLLFFSPGIREVIPLLSGRVADVRAYTTSLDCLPHERLWKIDLRKKRSALLQEFKAYLASVDAHRDENLAAWKRDDTRTRAEAWTHLKVWKLRDREKKGFPKIAKELKMKVDAAKKGFYRAFELIEGHPYDPNLYRQLYRAAIKKEDIRKTCAKCSQDVRDACGASGILCPEIRAYVDQDYVPLSGRTISPVEGGFIESPPARSTRPRKVKIAPFRK